MSSKMVSCSFLLTHYSVCELGNFYCKKVSSLGNLGNFFLQVLEDMLKKSFLLRKLGNKNMVLRVFDPPIFTPLGNHSENSGNGGLLWVL